MQIGMIGMQTVSFTELAKYSRKSDDSFPSYRLAVLGDCATQHISKAIKGYAFTEKLTFDVFDADYDQIDSQLLDKNSELYLFSPDFILLYLSSEKLYERYFATPEQGRTGFAEKELNHLKMRIQTLKSSSKANILVTNFAANNDCIFGNYANSVEHSYMYQMQKINYLMMEHNSQAHSFFVVDINALQSQYGRSFLHDEKLYFAAKMPISLQALPAVAKQIVDVIKTIKGRVMKCAILDLDNTLWGGVIGDDGLSGIQIGELGLGHAFTEFQMWLKELRRRGIILAICSKNNEEAAKEPFLQHDEMTLRLDDISVFVANWEDKATNIRYIQKVLNIGMDSIVFIDDNPFERNLVRSMIPEIVVAELPEDPALYVSYLKQCNYFETTSFSKTDGDRTKQYQAEMERIVLQQQFENYDDYLISLQMRATARAFDEYHTPRIAQLTQRSNQFNLRTVRYTEQEIKEIAGDTSCITIYFSLKDQYSDHGLVSVVIMKKMDAATLFVDTWLMSCRVLKRGMEEFIVNSMVRHAKSGGYKNIVGEYIKTPKNAMVKDIYESLGFTRGEDGLFRVDVNDFVDNKTYIMEENEHAAQ